MKLVFGTAAIGLPYGVPATAGAAPELIPEAAARALVRAAVDAGIRTFDTAPAYGVAEERLGRALAGAPGVAVWTKLGHDREWAAAGESVARSCARLGRERLDLLQIHNWSPSLGADAALAALARDPRVAALGCSTYGVDDARAAVRDGRFAVVQVEWNLLNQAVVDAVGDLARERGVRLAVRSVLLQGVLSDRPLPARLAGLAAARAAADKQARARQVPLARLALAAALAHPRIDHALVGLDAPAQLAEALAAVDLNLDARELADLHVGGPDTDPRTWGPL